MADVTRLRIESGQCGGVRNSFRAPSLADRPGYLRMLEIGVFFPGVQDIAAASAAMIIDGDGRRSILADRGDDVVNFFFRLETSIS